MKLGQELQELSSHQPRRSKVLLLLRADQTRKQRLGRFDGEGMRRPTRFHAEDEGDGTREHNYTLTLHGSFMRIERHAFAAIRGTWRS